MFDIKTNALPVEYIEVSSIWVRGDLGPVTVWSTDGTFDGKQTKEQEWTLHYQKAHTSSFAELVEMRLQEPVRLAPDSSRGFYVHSALPGDDAIVYDNQRHHESHSDQFLTITPGMAHLSNEPFSNKMPDGFWPGRPWRPHREFVGRVSYGVRWLLWNPDVHRRLPPSVTSSVWAMLLSQTEKARAHGCLLSYCDYDTLFFILNKVPWWEGASVQKELKVMLRNKKRARREEGLDAAAERGRTRGRRANYWPAYGSSHFGYFESDSDEEGSDQEDSDAEEDSDDEEQCSGSDENSDAESGSEDESDDGGDDEEGASGVHQDSED